MTRLAALRDWLSGCLHAAATTSARDAAYADRRCLDSAVWRVLA
jgi:hypothetical protein